ncbi:MAG: hypothetical protein AB7U73_24415 [Pirellulales bacterium]
MSLFDRTRIGWSLVLLYLATSLLCHLAHDPLAHGSGCCAHGTAAAIACGHDADSSAQPHGCRHAHPHNPGAPHAGDRHSPPGIPTHDAPTNGEHRCVVCQYLADPAHAADMLPAPACTGVVWMADDGEPLQAPADKARSYSSRAPPYLVA